VVPDAIVSGSRGRKEQEGIEGRVDGEYLQGGLGELSVINVVRVVVRDEDFERARSVIQAWESAQSEDAPAAAPARKASRFGVGLLLGLAVGIGGTYWAYTTPITSSGIDYTGDGNFDEVWIYRGNRLHRTEIDRNRDGRVDHIYEYDRRGLVQRSRSDDDFDGHFETVTHFRDGEAYLIESDRNQDGHMDYRAHLRHGVFEWVEFMDSRTGFVRKRQHYESNKPVSAEYDSSGDGVLDTCYRYDAFEEVIEKTRC
jgi:hypothetical protein